jgi:hypothetical protein
MQIVEHWPWGGSHGRQWGAHKWKKEITSQKWKPETD